MLITRSDDGDIGLRRSDIEFSDQRKLVLISVLNRPFFIFGDRHAFDQCVYLLRGSAGASPSQLTRERSSYSEPIVRRALTGCAGPGRLDSCHFALSAASLVVDPIALPGVKHMVQRQTMCAV